MSGKRNGIKRSIVSIMLGCVMLSASVPLYVNADEQTAQQQEVEEQTAVESDSSVGEKTEIEKSQQDKNGEAEDKSEKELAESHSSAKSETSQTSQTLNSDSQILNSEEKNNVAQDTASPEGHSKSSGEAEPNTNGSGKNMPTFEGTGTADNHVTVTAHAEAGVFPEGTSMKVTSASSNSAMQAAETLLDAPVIDAAAVDISFFDQNGTEIEPKEGRKVYISFQTDTDISGDTHTVIHIQDDGTAETVNSVSQVTGESAQFSAGSFSVYALVGTGDKSSCMETYEFYDSEGNVVSSQKVKKGDTLFKPEVPKTLDGKTFTGWTDDAGNYFESFGEVGDVSQDGATIALHASYQDAVYLYYYDQYGNLIESQPVAPNSTVAIAADTPLIQVQPLTECQDGWSTVQGGTEDVSGSFTVCTESVKLYPILKEGYWVDFQTNSESSVGRQFISRNAEGMDRQVKKPETDPVKQGYVFDQWYADKELSKPYDFTQEVTKPLTLYAGYKPASDTEYTVRYWIEYQKESGTGVGDGTWDYKMIAQEVLKGTTGDKAGYHTKLIFSAPYGKSDREYELNTDLTTANRYDPARPTIEADGSTVLNVYYRCKSYSLSINVPKADGTAQNLKYENVKCSADLTNFWKEVFSIRPESELFDGVHRFFFYLADGGAEFVEAPSNLSNMQAEDVAMNRQGTGRDNSFYEQYLETLHGKAPEGKTVVNNTSIRGASDTKTYYLQKEDQFSSGTFGGTNVTTNDFPGFTPVMEYSDGNYHPFGEHNAQVWFRYPESAFQSQNPGATYFVARNPYGTQHMYNGADEPIRIYYTRNSYSLNFHTEGGPEVTNQNVLYEDDLSRYNPSEYVVNQTAMKNGNEEFVFAGWYTDSNYSKPFDFNSTMPAYELDLYAKWVPRTYTVTFDTGKGSPFKKITNIRYGTTVARPENPTYEGHIFLGWTLDDRPYSFESGVTGDIVLKAEWRSIDAWRVQYDLNGGSGKCPSNVENYYENAGVTVASADGITAPEGKVFLGWKSSSDGKVYYPNASAPMSFGGMTLTAQWGDAEKTVQLIYDFNFERFGIHTEGNSSYTTGALKNNSRIELQDISSFRAVPSGYAFKGWYLDKECKDGPYNTVMADSLVGDGNRVYAKWNRIYTIIYTDGAGGSIFADRIYQVENGESTPEYGDTCSREGYIFRGWSPAVKKTVTGDETYSAVWEKNTGNTAEKTETGALQPTSGKTTGMQAVSAVVVSSTPKTGDSGQTMLWLVLLIISSASALMIVLAYHRRSY
jgi:uncharacterized repeat protein (TIGR02543 family)